MDIIYVDSLFFLNTAVNYFILLATARLCPHASKRLRLALAAALGGLYAVGTVLPEAEILLCLPMKALCALVMVLIAFGGLGHFGRTAVIFLAVSAAFGGAVWAISMLFYGFSPERLYIPVSLPMLAVSFALCYAAVTLVFRRIGDRAVRCLRCVEITLGARHAEFTALEDTGNALCDPITAMPVIAATADALAPLLPPNIRLTGCAEEDFRLLAQDEALRARLRLIPYSAVGTESGLLLALRPDRILADGKPTRARLIAITPNAVSADGEYQALI